MSGFGFFISAKTDVLNRIINVIVVKTFIT